MFFNYLKVQVIILTLLFQYNYSQQILENRETCKFVKSGVAANDSLYIQSTTWTVTSALRDMKNKVVKISFCGLMPSAFGCKPSALVCILDRKNPSMSILNAGESFEHGYDTEKNRDILRSVNGQRCSDTEKFRTIVELACEPNTFNTKLQDAPRILFADECELRLEMLSSNPKCDPLCTTRVNGYLIDLRDLKTLGSFQIRNSVTKSFELSFCGGANGCGNGIAMCETTSGITPIADTNTLSVSYKNEATNELVMKGHHGSGKRSRLNVIVHLKCNWNERGVNKLKYIVPSTQGKNYKFEGESSMACVKMPMDCTVINRDDNRYVYDLKSLNNPHGPWNVQNITSGNMYINMCGLLRLPFGNNICTRQSSQVCFKDNTGKFFNLGSVANNFHVTDDDTVKVFFTYGGTCATNTTKSYDTEIEFVCSKQEHGPILQSEVNCTYRINWKTPAACPTYMKDSCNLETHVGSSLSCAQSINTNCRLYSKDTLYDLTQLMLNSSNYIVQDSDDSNVTYVLNICRSLVDTKDLVCPVNSGACAKNLVEPHIKHMYKSIGGIQTTTALVLEGGNPVLTYSMGSFCRAELTHHSLKIQFECSTKEEGLRFLSKTACMHRFIWRTPYACPRKVFTLKTKRSVQNNCIYKHPKNNKIMDLGGISSDLILEFIAAGRYIFNICGQKYSYCSNKSGAECEIVSGAQMSYETDQIHLVYILKNICDKDQQANIVRIQLICDSSKEEEEFELIKVSNCTMFITLTSNNICQDQISLKSLNEILSTTLSKPRTTTEKHVKKFLDSKPAVSGNDIQLTSLPLVESLNCSIVNANAGFNLKNINFRSNSTAGSNYSLAFGSRTVNCSGYICINGTEYLQRSDVCPIVVFDTAIPVIKLLFNSHQVCNDGRMDLEIWLKCKFVSAELPTVKQSPCKIVIIYPVQEACSLLKSTTTSVFNTDTAIAIAIGCTMFIVMVLIITFARRCIQYYKKTKNGYECIKNRNKQKQRTPVYYKNSTL